MNREQIIRMAREAGAMFDHMTWVERDLAPVFERFSALVAAAERNKLAAWMMRQGYATGHGDTIEDLLKELDWQIDERIAAEREACAALLDAAVENFTSISLQVNDEDGIVMEHANTCSHLAASIRARGQA